MKNLTYILQIFTGGFKEDATTYNMIETKLTPLLGKLPIKAIIAGWQINPSLYSALKSLLIPYDIPLYLWLPVFSEISDIKLGKKVILASGQEMERFQLNEGEGFDFLCPNTPINKQNVLDTYHECFSQTNFDGVFLDRIRYPSFSNGYESIFTCFCDVCKEKMSQHNLPITWYQDQVKQAKITKSSAFKLEKSSYPYHTFTDSRWRQFFDFKHRCISEVLSEIINHFKGLDLKVGLDVFSPFITDFIGQDVPNLSKHVDFIKPMMYEKTLAPAGIPFEIGKFKEGFSSIKKTPYSLERDQHFNQLVEMSTCPIHPGFEVNYIKDIADTSVDYISDQLKRYENHKDIHSVVLSWNLLEMPDAHLNYLIQALD